MVLLNQILHTILLYRGGVGWMTNSSSQKSYSIRSYPPCLKNDLRGFMQFCSNICTNPMNCAKKAPNPAERYSFRMLLDSRKILS
jgi:hypothetical protein